jgi:hypothetical protein
MRCPLAARFALAIAAATLAVGCAATRPIALHPAPAVLPSAAALDDALATRRDALHSLRALARLRYQAPHESSASRQAIVVARPDQVRVEVLSLFGAVFVLTADHGAMTAYTRQENTWYRGQASPENLGRYAHLNLPVSDLVDVVLAIPPPLSGSRTEVSFDAEVGAVRLFRHRSAAGAQLVWFSDAILPIATEERNANGAAQWRATFARYEDHGGVPIATQIGLELPQWSRTIEIALEDIDVNPTLDESIFALQTPPGSKVVDLDRVAD